MFLRIVFSILSLPAALSANEPLKVCTFSTVLTEVAEQVGGDWVKVTPMIKIGVDPHEFEPKPADLRIVADSRVVLLSAKHMEGYVGKLKDATGAKARLVEVGNAFPSLQLEHDGHAEEDPHWWHSVENAIRATGIVRDAFIKAVPEHRADFEKNAAAYAGRLEALKKWVKVKVAELPRDRRKLVTSHDAFQYFARENGFTIYAIEGLSTTDQPSSSKVAEIMRTIEEQKVKAIFPDSSGNPKVLQEITRETGAKIGGELFADGLGEGDLSTYEGMMKHNVSTIVDALK